jgi:uncharacterized protein YecT (DUF1311 family)
MASLDSEGQNLLRKSQRAWVTFRDSEAALERHRSGEGGSLGGLIFINKKLDLTLSRAEELAKVAK